MKKKIKNMIKLFIFLSIGISPFITMTHFVGINIFLDSFENSEYYICFQDEDDKLGLEAKNGEYIIIQRKTHPDFYINNNDIVIYYEGNGKLTCDKYKNIKIGPLTSYNYENIDYPNFQIPKSQVVGKIINIIDGNIWNSISIKMWKTSINNLNIGAILAED